MKSRGYVIGRYPADTDISASSYFAEGYRVGPTFTYRRSANRYGSMRDAIQVAKMAHQEGWVTYVCRYERPTGQDEAVVWQSNEPTLRYLYDIDPTAVRVYRPLHWQLRGYQQTASGYGSRLLSTHCIRLSDGRERRIYITQYSNTGTAWIILNGRNVIVDGRIGITGGWRQSYRDQR